MSEDDYVLEHGVAAVAAGSPGVGGGVRSGGLGRRAREADCPRSPSQTTHWPKRATALYAREKKSLYIARDF